MIPKGHFAQYAARMTKHLAIGETLGCLTEYRGGQTRRAPLVIVIELDATTIVGAIIGQAKSVCDDSCTRYVPVEDFRQPFCANLFTRPGNITAGPTRCACCLLTREGGIDLDGEGRVRHQP